MATMVRPMIIGGTFNFLAMLELPSTKRSAPFTRKAKPASNSRITAAIGNPLIKSCITFSFTLVIIIFSFLEIPYKAIAQV